MPSDIAISVKNLKKIYNTNNHDKKTALDNVSLNINKGSIFGLLGPNGAGKSTFINILADLVKKTSGQIEVLGINHEKNLKEVKKLMGIVPQELNIDPFFTPYELLEIQAGYLLGERLLRPALVSVSKRKNTKDQENTEKKDKK